MNASNANAPLEQLVVVGNICETGDIFTVNSDKSIERELPLPQVGDVIAICDVGAYGMSMTSQYNLRSRPAEVLVNEGQAQLIRKADSYEDMLAPYRV